MSRKSQKGVIFWRGLVSVFLVYLQTVCTVKSFQFFLGRTIEECTANAACNEYEAGIG